MKFVFLGTDTFSSAILEKLINDYYRPELVITQPDKPVGRKQILTSPLIKHICDDHNIKVLQPENLNDAVDDLKALDLDLIIVASFGRIIPESILSIPAHSAINIHTSLLPRYRGASPIQAAILNGDEETGITVIQMDKELDHGAIIFQKSIEIADDETYRSLHTKLAKIGSDVIARILPDYLSGRLKPEPQSHEDATFTSIIKKEDARIDWTKSCAEIERSVRAYYDWPIAWTALPDGKRLKVLRAHLHEGQSGDDEPGKLLITKTSAGIACADGILELDLVQVEGGNKPLSEEEFIRGYSKFNEKLCSESL